MSNTLPQEDEIRVMSDLGFTPEIATELGHMCVAWALLEWRLFCLFCRLSDLPTALARASFYSHNSTRGRIELVLTTASMVLHGSQKRTAAFVALDKLTKSIRRTATKRNAYIHDPWAADPWNPYTTVSQLRLSGKGIHGDGERVSQKDIHQLTGQIVTWADKVHDLDDRIAPLLPSSLEKLDRTRSVTLEFAKTGRRPRSRLLTRP